MGSNMLRILTILATLLVSQNLVAQDFVAYHKTLKQLYQEQEYDLLVKHSLTNVSTYNYYYQRYFMGVALLQTGQSRAALNYLWDARKRNNNDTLRRSIAYTFLSLSRIEDAHAMSPKVGPKSKWLEGITLAGSYRINAPDSINSPVTTGYLGAYGYYKRLRWDQSLQYYRLKLLPGGADTLQVAQYQHYARVTYRPAYRFSGSLAWHTVLATGDTSQEWSYMGYAEALWHGRLGYIGPLAAVGRVNSTVQWQTGIQGMYMPFSDYTFYIKGQLTWQHLDSTHLQASDSVTFSYAALVPNLGVAEISVGKRVMSGLWAEGSLVLPVFTTRSLDDYRAMYYYTGNRAEGLYNAADPTRWKAAFSVAYYLTPKIKMMATLQSEARLYTPANTPYYQNGLSIGLSWKL